MGLTKVLADTMLWLQTQRADGMCANLTSLCTRGNKKPLFHHIPPTYTRLSSYCGYAVNTSTTQVQSEGRDHQRPDALSTS